MDGNGRWAKKRGLPRSAGHRAGARTIQKLVEDCDKIGLRYLTAYAFSTENWKRSEKEVSNLMNLVREFLADTNNKLDKSNIRIKVIGLRNRLADDIIELIKETEEKSADKTGLTFIIALDYGARAEITEAVRNIATECVTGNMNPGDITEETVTRHLYTRGIPDPDLIIRSSGEKRMSNYLLWQASYSELCFLDVLWPDFNVNHILEAAKEYNIRNRRFGGVRE